MTHEENKKPEAPIPARRRSRAVFPLLAMLFALSASAHASVALLMEESYGTYGSFAPTGHSAVYLNHICAESPTQLRLCQPGEFGVVISRYHKISGRDWIAVPLIPYLYAVDTPAEVPASVDQAQVDTLRDAYRREHLLPLVPDSPRGGLPKGNWIQLVGSSYDRAIHVFQVNTTPEQDERFIALMNDKRNVGHFNLLFRNCADFSRSVLDLYLPHAIRRNFIADIGLTTPKQVARSLVAYGKNNPEVEISAFIIPQVAGDLPRSHSVDGITESIVKSKKYILPIAVLSPAVAGGAVVAYLARGRMALPKDAAVFSIADQEIPPDQAPSSEPTGGGESITPVSTSTLSTPPAADVPTP